MPDFITDTNASLLDVTKLFSAILRQLLAVPELALFLGTALLLIVVGVFSWVIRQGKKL